MHHWQYIFFISRLLNVVDELSSSIAEKKVPGEEPTKIETSQIKLRIESIPKTNAKFSIPSFGVTIPPEALDTNEALSIKTLLYKRDFLFQQNKQVKNSLVLSPVVSASVGDKKVSNLSSPIVLKLNISTRNVINF